MRKKAIEDMTSEGGKKGKNKKKSQQWPEDGQRL